MKKRNDIICKAFSKKVIIHRGKQKISQMKLAEIVECTINTINNIETGRCEPSFEMALKLSKVLSISLDEMTELVLKDLK